MGKGNKVFFALLAGAAAGVAIGMLIASGKDSENKKKITETAKKFADSLLEKAEEVIDNMSEGKSNI